jgi:hypothetical protein
VIVFWDESGASLLPVTRRTWAPRGHAPVIRHHFNWKRASMAVALCYGSLGGGATVCFHHQHGAYDADTLIGALGKLRAFLGGQKATLVWDGLPAHRGLAMAAWLRCQRSWLVVEPLPGYAPELNPVGATRSRFQVSGFGGREERREGRDPDQCPGLSPLWRASLVTAGCEARSQSRRGGPAIGPSPARRRLEG